MLEKKVKHALEILEKFRDWQHKFLMFSGGKDSLVCLDLCAKAWKDNFKVIYIEITGNTHPECTKYVHKVVNEYGLNLIHLKQQRYDFFELLEKYGYPHIAKERWCMNLFKDNVLKEFTKKISLTITIAGVKQGDSSIRKTWISKAVFNGIVVKPNKYAWGKIQVLPLYNWWKSNVWDYIKQNELPVNPLYSEIGSSGNCVICPAMRKDTFIAVMRKCQEFFCKWKKAHEKLRQRDAELKPKRVGKIFKRFDKWYELYCLNKTLVEVV